MYHVTVRAVWLCVWLCVPCRCVYVCHLATCVLCNCMCVLCDCVYMYHVTLCVPCGCVSCAYVQFLYIAHERCVYYVRAFVASLCLCCIHVYIVCTCTYIHVACTSHTTFVWGVYICTSVCTCVHCVCENSCAGFSFGHPRAAPCLDVGQPRCSPVETALGH